MHFLRPVRVKFPVRRENWVAVKLFRVASRRGQRLFPVVRPGPRVVMRRVLMGGNRVSRGGTRKLRLKTFIVFLILGRVRELLLLNCQKPTVRQKVSVISKNGPFIRQSGRVRW